MTKTGDERYAEIMRRMQARKAKRAAATVQTGLAAVLDQLNAWDVLAQAAGRAPRGMSAWGPKTVKRADSVRVVIWYKAGGYYGYKQLILLGAWSLDKARLVVGVKMLPYAQQTYNPESYHKIIRKDYAAYYKDDGLPPVEPLLDFTYAAADRLAQRARLAEVIGAYSPG